MLLGSDDNENKLRGAEDSEPKEAPSGYGDTKLFDSSNNNQQSEDGDLVKDSFMLSMKANDPESVSEKLSTASAEVASATPASTPSLFGDDDELSNFELDSSISAFKPLGDNVPSFAGSSTESSSAANAFAAPKKEEPAKEEVKKDNTPLFTDDDPDFKAFADNTNTDPFKAGEELDFAMSSNAKESDFNTAPAVEPAPAPAPAPEVKNDPLDDLELDEEALAISPFKPKGAVDTPAPAPAPAPAAPVKEEPKKVEEEAKAEEPAQKPAPAPEAKEEPSKAEKKPNMQTYGNVKSGVNAFGKKEDKEKKPEDKEAPKAAPAPKAPHRSPFAAAPVAPAPVPANQQPIGSGRPGAPTAATTDPSKFRPIPQQQRPQPVVKKSPAPNQRPAASAPQNAVVNQRPGMSDASAKKEPSPFQAPSSRPSAAQQPKPTPHVQQPISPVTTVNQNKKRGKGGLVIVIVAALALVLVVLGIENWDKLFGGDTVVSPDNTRDTAVTTTEEETTTTTSEETTTTTTEETTTTSEETTESSEETEETTVETTEETTEATTEATTAATTAETTAATTTAAATGTASFRYSIANPHSNGSQFSFDLVITNTGNSDSSFNGSVQSLDITFSVEPTEIEITGISSDYYTFTQDANDPCTFHGTPTSGTVPAGGELSTTITCTTSEPVQHFYITNYHFELR